MAMGRREGKQIFEHLRNKYVSLKEKMSSPVFRFMLNTVKILLQNPQVSMVKWSLFVVSVWGCDGC